MYQQLRHTADARLSKWKRLKLLRWASRLMAYFGTVIAMIGGNFVRGYRDLSGGRLDKWAGWPPCRMCGKQLPQRCAYCVHCFSFTPVDIRIPSRNSSVVLFTTPGMAAAISIGDAVLTGSLQRRAVTRAVGLERVSMLPGAIVVVPLLVLSGYLNGSGHSALSYTAGIGGLALWLLLWLWGSASKELLQRELDARLFQAKMAESR
ncbi:hypothetical protein ASC58_10220 [Phycicoccus sp. Root101]|nr:hypothetical protein ASC58_10220 [Phycicoccus sp. Root101]